MICRQGDKRYWSHQWSKWQNATLTREDNYRTWKRIAQERHCERCNKQIVREVKAS